MTYPRPKEPGFVSARQCAALDAGWVVLYDRTKKGPVEFEKAARAGNKRFSREATKRYVILYRPDPDESRTWATPGKWFGTDNLGEARKLVVAIAAGEDTLGVLPVADAAVMGGMNQRQFMFCQYVLAGKPLEEAHRLAGYKTKQHARDASELVKKPKVLAYLDKMRAKTAKTFTMTRDGLLAWHQRVLETAAGEIDKNHDLCQEYEETEDKIKYKMPPKMTAAQEIKGMMGWDKATQASDEESVLVKAAASLLEQFMHKPKE